MKLTGKERQRIRRALLQAFPDPGQLRMVVNDADIGTSFENLTLGVRGYEVAIFDLIEWASAQNRLMKLIGTAREAAPDNSELEAVSAFMERYASLRPDRSLGELEQVLFPNSGFQNVLDWQDKLEQLRGRICRIEPQPRSEGPGGYATGFLVAPDVVITNDHVVSGQGDAPGFWARPDLAARVRCRFDCLYRQDGSLTEGTEHELATDYSIVRSPVAEHDFALFKLARRAGDDVAGGRPRGFVTPVGHAFESREPILILQHPEAEPLKLAFGALAPSSEWPPSRIAYQVNTNPGSSGSPVATQALEVAALHQGGSAAVNQGVPMSAILSFLRMHPERARLEQAGLGHLLSSKNP